MTREEFEHALVTKAPHLQAVADPIWTAAGTLPDADGIPFPLVLAAVCDRESRGGLALRPDGNGSDGHGCGIFQFDDRYWSDFCISGDANDPTKASKAAAELLVANFKVLKSWRPAIAAYNCGRSAARRALAAGEDPDVHTTGGDYSSWVLRRATALSKK